LPPALPVPRDRHPPQRPVGVEQDLHLPRPYPPQPPPPPPAVERAAASRSARSSSSSLRRRRCRCPRRRRARRGSRDRACARPCRTGRSENRRETRLRRRRSRSRSGVYTTVAGDGGGSRRVGDGSSDQRQAAPELEGCRETDEATITCTSTALADSGLALRESVNYSQKPLV
jgi:hypothetical protein